MARLVYLATRMNPSLVSDLARAGHYVWRALAVSETLYLCKTADIDAIVVGADVADPAVAEVQSRVITIRLKPEATVQELIWELSHMFPGGAATTQ